MNLDSGDAILTFSSKRFALSWSFLALNYHKLSPVAISISLFLVFYAMYVITSSSVQILIMLKSDLVSSTLVVASDPFHIVLNLIWLLSSPMVIPISLFLMFSAMYFIMSSSVQILLIVDLYLASSNLVVSCSAFRGIVNVFLLVSITNLILKCHSMVFSSFILVAAASFPIPAATAFWPASRIFGVYHHPTAATPSSCNCLMKPKFDRLIPFLGVSFKFFLRHLSVALPRASPNFWCFLSHSAHTPERHPSWRH